MSEQQPNESESREVVNFAVLQQSLALLHKHASELDDANARAAEHSERMKQYQSEAEDYHLKVVESEHAVSHIKHEIETLLRNEEEINAELSEAEEILRAAQQAIQQITVKKRDAERDRLEVEEKSRADFMAAYMARLDYERHQEFAARENIKSSLVIAQAYERINRAKIKLLDQQRRLLSSEGGGQYFDQVQSLGWGN